MLLEHGGVHQAHDQVGVVVDVTHSGVDGDALFVVSCSAERVLDYLEEGGDVLLDQNYQVLETLDEVFLSLLEVLVD